MGQVINKKGLEKSSPVKFVPPFRLHKHGEGLSHVTTPHLMVSDTSDSNLILSDVKVKEHGRYSELKIGTITRLWNYNEK
jgi:hypothetical protein